MYRVVTLIFICLLVASATAQETEAPVAEEPAAATADASAEPGGEVAEVAAEEDDEVVVDDADLDEQTYEEDDDDFIPTEEIPADEPIAFPSNI